MVSDADCGCGEAVAEDCGCDAPVAENCGCDGGATSMNFSDTSFSESADCGCDSMSYSYDAPIMDGSMVRSLFDRRLAGGNDRMGLMMHQTGTICENGNCSSGSCDGSCPRMGFLARLKQRHEQCCLRRQMRRMTRQSMRQTEEVTEDCGCEEEVVEDCGCDEEIVADCGCEEEVVEDCGCGEVAAEGCGCGSCRSGLVAKLKDRNCAGDDCGGADKKCCVGGLFGMLAGEKTGCDEGCDEGCDGDVVQTGGLGLGRGLVRHAGGRGLIGKGIGECGVRGCGHHGMLCPRCRGLAARAAAHVAGPNPYGGQVPHTAQVPGAGTGMAPAYAYPYYTTRGPRDFLMDNPPSIGY